MLDERDISRHLEEMCNYEAFIETDNYTEDGEVITRHINNVRDFESAGVLTRNQGFVITLDDGSEFQVTVVQSKQARNT